MDEENLVYIYIMEYCWVLKRRNKSFYVWQPEWMSRTLCYIKWARHTELRGREQYSIQEKLDDSERPGGQRMPNQLDRRNKFKKSIVQQVTIINNNVLFSWKSVHFKFSHHKNYVKQDIHWLALFDWSVVFACIRGSCCIW